MALKDIKGQDRAVEFFRNSVNREKLAHAYLFLGPQGAGKRLLAKNLAKFLNCENPIKEENLFTDCCDGCISCRKIDNLNHPDAHWIEREGKSRRISIDEIRLLQKEASLKSYEGKFKVFVILEAQNMTEEAANSLLKTLEEPPDNCLIILTSTNVSGLLPTIISRCQIVKFYPLKLKLERRPFSFSPGSSSINIFNIKDKKELAEQIRYLLNWFRDILVFKIGLPTSDIINADRTKEIESQAGLFDFHDLEQIIEKIDRAHRLIEQNVNPKIALEVMLRGIAECKR